MNILVLGGGDSPERDVSLRSAVAVAEALGELGHAVTSLDPRDDKAKLSQALAQTDLVFPVLHGAGGEDGQIQRVIEAAGKPYLGSGVAASELCFDKAAYKQLLQQHDLLTPAFEIVNRSDFESSPLRQKPFVLKPFDGGSSLDTFIVHNPSNLPAGIPEAFDRNPAMLLEELIEGVETTVAVLGDEALPMIEIIPPRGQEFDYENKYNGATQELCPPQNVALADQRAASRLAETVHRLTDCRDLSRTDIIITNDHKLYLLETNTMPGMTSQSLFPKAAATAELTWTDLVTQLVGYALRTSMQYKELAKPGTRRS